VKATGWQPHSVRGFLSGTIGKKMATPVESFQSSEGDLQRVEPSYSEEASVVGLEGTVLMAGRLLERSDCATQPQLRTGGDDFQSAALSAPLEQKANALGQAAPLEGWPLPEELLELRRQMEVRLGKHGRREFVQVLRLLETSMMAEVSAAAPEALRIPAISFDAVKHLLLCAIECRVPKLDLENYPHLPAAEVALTRAADYQVLLGEVR
jgi:Protein of unknown function (DUF3489)